MSETRKMLFPVDPSGISAKLAPEVVEMAAKLDAEVHLLLVVEGIEGFKTFYVPHPSLDKFEAESLVRAGRMLQEFEEAFFSEYPKTKRVVVKGDPAEEILKYITAEHIDMVMIGTHGRKGLDRIIFGSVADEVVKKSPVPVTSINPYRKRD